MNSKHHFYYVVKRLKQLIESEILYETKYTFTKQNIINTENFQEIIKNIENATFEEKQICIEFTTSFLVKQLLVDNSIRNDKKEHGDYRIEKVDVRHHGGGYGFYGDWLNVFHLLTFIYAYQTITKEDLIDYMYAFRQKIVNPKFNISPVSFLFNPNKKVILLNKTLKNDFSKYELMNALQNIMAKELYFPNSYLGTNGIESIKKIMKQYTLERENILALLEENYKRKLILK